MSREAADLAKHFASRARYVADYGRVIVTLLDPKPGERVLDVGCGDGSVSQMLKASGATVVGVDIDPEMVELACANGIDARVMDGRSLEFEGEFDAVFANASLHFIRPFELAIRNARRVLRPGGRFAAELGSHGNIAAITTALLAVLRMHGIDGASRLPWTFPTAEEYCDLLEQAGFRIETVSTFHRPTLMPEGIRAWIDLLGRWFLEALPPEDRGPACDEAERLLAYSLRTTNGRWTADYHHLRFKARLG